VFSECFAFEVEDLFLFVTLSLSKGQKKKTCLPAVRL